MIAVVDSGPLVAVANRRDPDHDTSVAILSDLDWTFVVPALCIAEASHLVLARAGARAELAFLHGLDAFSIEAPVSEDWPRIRELAAQYADWPLGAVDASVVALAERLATDVVVTLDRRHFGAVRPRHYDAFRLMP